MMLLRRILFLIFDFRFPICGTQSVLASFLKKWSQTQKSEIRNQKSAIAPPTGGAE